MHRLPLITLILCLCTQLWGQNPHGQDFAVDCAACHNPGGWAIDIDTFHFNHDTTAFPLSGQHLLVDCKVCHVSLIFGEADNNCINCHQDIHSMTVGNDCIRCHTQENWLVDDIPELHEQNGFPLIGAHNIGTCVSCHISETNLRFDRIGNDCINCHREDYDATENPNHEGAGFSTNCIDCHSPEGDGWNTDIVVHSFFPLTEGHDIQDCKVCHITDNFSDASPECISCHKDDFDATTDPNHGVLNFDNDCTRCHTTAPGWTPAEFRDHDALYFPIYSGKHEGEWDACTDCHIQAGDYSVFSCIVCHERGETDGEHDDVPGYVYEDNACLACHPTGDGGLIFDHNTTSFALTGGHFDVECIQCHQNGFEGTTTQCIGCHSVDFENSANPDHRALNLSTDCVSCHTTDPDWNPARFDNHDDFYVLEGAHAAIADRCVDCHNGDYINTPNTCYGCHQGDYEATTDPDHRASNFSQNCTDCHSQDAWIPSTFDHDGQYFPIFSGKHNGVWTDCLECHQNANDYSQFTCIACHLNPETDDAHTTVAGYVYEDHACLACHPTGDADMAFDHDNTAFPLTGAHRDATCLDCHANGYEGTSTVCADCHQMDYEAALNPNHGALMFPDDCASCHTTDPGWAPARLDNHDDFYPLNGAHALIANQCVDCHNSDYLNTPNTCVGCHLPDYEATTDPNHVQAQFNTDCTLCHGEGAWVPSNFDHDGQYFPIYSGKHDGEWMQCLDCHTNANDYSQFTCIACHLNPETDEAHMGVGGYVYADPACLACHPTGDTENIFDHDNTNFPLTGAHVDATCLDCHSGGFDMISSDCVSCHLNDFEASLNPSHTDLNIPMDCAQCHTTDPGWAPALFEIHHDYYVLEGAHAAIAQECMTCHNGDYVNTPNTCVGCHLPDYEGTTSPDHEAAQFSTDCIVCHGQDVWIPANFDHDVQYFPIYSGSHQGEWTECIDCHNNPANFAVFDCLSCHLNPETDDAHLGVGGYVYESTACLACHPTGEADMAFDHNNTLFPLTGAHIGLECLECHAGGFENTSTLCVDCHMADYTASANPDHTALNIPTDCIACHTTDPGWEPATFDIHDDYWPLTGVHLTIANQCADCHNGDYVNTPNACDGCHMPDYNASVNPDHASLNIPVSCADCHTTDPDWMPASFDIHDDYYPLNGAHALIANQCVDCHNGDYVNTPNTCIGCHQADYDGTTNPDHASAGFPTDCLLCHTEDAWLPSTLDHDGMYFPIYSGKHDGEWSVCTDCHINPGDFSVFSCIVCHLNPETDNEHQGIGGYIYEDNACLACHPTGDAADGIDHDNTNFPLTGAHIGLDCIDCHFDGFVGTPTDCDACHNDDYIAATNPNHISLGLPTDCITCHTTDPGWAPAAFAIHDDFWPLTGAHLVIADQCVDCHNGDYVNTPNTCDGCHIQDYNDSTNPDHGSLNIPLTCDDCHTTDPGWAPAAFGIHDDFWPLTGAHLVIADQCVDCHNGDYVNTPNSCDGCHMPDYNASINPDHASLNIPVSCADCHTTDPDWMPASFDIHDDYYPLNGAHALIADQCVTCHNGDYVNTPNTCYGCHQADYDTPTNPDHSDAGFSTDCTQCHSEDAWTPSSFDHNAFYPLNGAHALIASDCNACHFNGYVNTPNTCIGCHQNDYDGTTNPDHAAAGFPTDCLACHTEDAWTPANWDHDGMYFPIFSGKHDGEWNQCIDCHTTPNDYTMFSCIDCHFHDDEADNADIHENVGGYIYESNACYSCHPNGED